MILGYLLGRKTYKLQKICFVLAIVVGVIMFAFKEEYNEKDGEDPLLGDALIAVSLLMDGLLGATEDRMRQAARPTALNLMHFVNLWSSGIYIVGVAPKFVEFITKHPEICKYFGLVLIVGALGQIFINSMVANFGPLPLSITTTTRKFFSVFLSVILFGNSLSIRQWCAAAIIFGVLFLDAALNKKMKVKTDDEKVDEEKAQEEVTVVEQTKL
jgi:solute carrier family 35 (UDP-galactose transporter), member B1